MARTVKSKARAGFFSGLFGVLLFVPYAPSLTVCFLTFPTCLSVRIFLLLPGHLFVHDFLRVGGRLSL